MDPAAYPLASLADRVGTPFYLYDAQILRQRFAALAELTEGAYLLGRYAMKACSATQVLDMARRAGLWIDAVSGNEILRARRAGFPMGSEPPVVMLSTDVFRDNALTMVLEQRVLPNLGSPGMLGELRDAGYRGAVALRVNPGFGHGHVASCDTGGPSSKHGIWHEDLERVLRLAADVGCAVIALHAHVGTGPERGEFEANMRRLVAFFEPLVAAVPTVGAVNLGGGMPYAYRPDEAPYDARSYRPVLLEAHQRLSRVAGRPIRIEIEPGRWPVVAAGALVMRVRDVKHTARNDKGAGHDFVMVDAGFSDLARPALYGAYHHISVVGRGAGRAPEPLVVAGPLCESGDVFTRDAHELLDPRLLPRPEAGDLLFLHDAGAYGYSMASNYVSLGRAPQIMWDDGATRLISRRETVDDIVRLECDEPV